MEAKIQEDAIVIDDNDMVQQSINPPSIQKTPGNTFFDIQLAIEKEVNNYEDPQAMINRRLTKYFEYGKKIEPGKEYLCARKQPDYSGDAELVGNELIIYGCDFKKMKLVKKEYETNKAIRINESNYKLIYPDASSAWKAIEKNIKDPSSIVRKMESEDMALPKCWFEMQPYTVHNLIVKVYARFALDAEKNLEPQQQAAQERYRQCSQIYNQQEKRIRQQQISNQNLKREKLQMKRQFNSERLYQGYENNAEREWKRGRNNNPGANRENSRSRSRQAEKKIRGNQMEDEVEINDNASNWSFILSKSKKDLKELNAALGDIDIKDKSVQGDLSIILGPSKGDKEYNWGGKGPQYQSGRGLGAGYKWDYRAYMRQQEEQQELARQGKLHHAAVITIEDDN